MTRVKINTKQMAFADRDLEVMLVFLKILVFYANLESPKKLSTSRWDNFFCNCFPNEAKADEKGNYSVWALTDAKKYLTEKAIIIKTKPQGKKYHLFELNMEKINVVIDRLTEKARDYDEQLLLDIQDYYEANDTGIKGKYATQEDAFNSMNF